MAKKKTNGKNGRNGNGCAVEMWPVDKIKPYPKNPRVNDKAVDAVARSIRDFGFRQPIVVNKKGEIIVGHTRLKAAIKNGAKTVPVHVADLTAEQARSYRLADNQIATIADWDVPLLADELTELGELGVDLESLGWNADELDAILHPDGKPGLTDPDEIPETPKDPTTKPGDLWLCGEHRVLCGDATEGDSVGRMLDGVRVGSVLTDPPYGIGFDYESHDDSRDAWFPLMDGIVPKLRSVAPIVVMPCCGIDRIDWWYANHRPDWMICWYKGSPGHRSHIGFNDWEAHLVWGKPPKQMHDYFQTACGFEVKGHPCPKPVAWGVWLCERVCESGGILYDPFLGSGTTLIAAEQLTRKCYGLEIEPKYVDVIVNRWQNFTGKHATLDKDGRNFNEVADGR